MILDEAHCCKNYRTNIARVLLSGQEGQYRLFITATPIQNAAKDLLTILACCVPSVSTAWIGAINGSKKGIDPDALKQLREKHMLQRGQETWAGQGFQVSAKTYFTYSHHDATADKLYILHTYIPLTTAMTMKTGHPEYQLYVGKYICYPPTIRSNL